MEKIKNDKLKNKAVWVRKKILEMAVKAGAGHIAPSFSCTEILVALHYGGILRIKPQNPKWSNRDRFILSKGQSAVALYAVLADLGFFPIKELMTFTSEGSRLGGHAEDTIPGVEAFTGSLGHGLSIGAGLSLAAKMDNKKYNSYVLMGDGECHEGSVWEAAMFAGQHKLNNLIAIVDHNGLSATDFLKTYLEVDPLGKKWESFGWDVYSVDGHSIEDILEVMNKIYSRDSDKPIVIIAATTKGKGVSFMENNPIWHYRIPVGKELRIARNELSNKKNNY
ncbi:MAG: transketolase [Candidatus Omnitrophica bacterium]|nr:transketolase [Candidatus Omnitrophota bacterium]